MLPQSLLNASQGSPILVELKNGETFNGHLVNCDAWMNVILKEVIMTSPTGTLFTRIPEIYIKGNNIKYLRIPEAVVDKIKSEQAKPQKRPAFNQRGNQKNQRGGRGNSNQKRKQ